MRRRSFIAGLGGAAVVGPRGAWGQRPTIPLIGFLNGGAFTQWASLVAIFRKGLRDAGYTEGHNLAIEYRWAEGQYDKLPALVADLLNRNVKAIVAFGNVAARYAKAATATTPVIFVTGDDPVAVGLVSSLNQPGGNATGISMNAGELPTKRLQLLHEIIPTATSIAMLVNPSNANSKPDIAAVQQAAHTLGKEIQPILYASTEREFEPAFTSLVQSRARGILINTDAVFSGEAKKLAALALLHGLPSIYHSREYTEAGGLAGYGSSRADAWRQLAVYTGRILNGEKPSDLPVVQASKFEFSINLKTARTLGITVPATLLARADEVIE